MPKNTRLCSCGCCSSSNSNNLPTGTQQQDFNQRTNREITNSSPERRDNDIIREVVNSPEGKNRFADDDGSGGGNQGSNSKRDNNNNWASGVGNCPDVGTSGRSEQFLTEAAECDELDRYDAIDPIYQSRPLADQTGRDDDEDNNNDNGGDSSDNDEDNNDGKESPPERLKGNAHVREFYRLVLRDFPDTGKLYSGRSQDNQTNPSKAIDYGGRLTKSGVNNSLIINRLITREMFEEYGGIILGRRPQPKDFEQLTKKQAADIFGLAFWREATYNNGISNQDVANQWVDFYWQSKELAVGVIRNLLIDKYGCEHLRPRVPMGQRAPVTEEFIEALDRLSKGKWRGELKPVKKDIDQDTEQARCGPNAVERPNRDEEWGYENERDRYKDLSPEEEDPDHEKLKRRKPTAQKLKEDILHQREIFLRRQITWPQYRERWYERLEIMKCWIAESNRVRQIMEYYEPMSDIWPREIRSEEHNN